MTINDLSQLDLGIIVGLLEGEGYIGLGLKASGTFQPVVDISNTELSILNFVHEKIGIGSIQTSNRNKPKRSVKPLHYFTIRRQEGIVAFLEIVLPHLISKRRAAVLVMKFCKLRLKNRRHSKDVHIPKNFRRYGGKGFKSLREVVKELLLENPNLDYGIIAQKLGITTTHLYEILYQLRKKGVNIPQRVGSSPPYGEKEKEIYNQFKMLRDV